MKTIKCRACRKNPADGKLDEAAGIALCKACLSQFDYTTAPLKPLLEEVKKAKALKGSTVSRSGKTKASLAKAHEETSHNNEVLRAVWGGKVPKTALAYEEDGGSIKRVGIPAGGYPPAVKKALEAHTKLFGGKAPSIPGVTKPMAGRPRGRTTGADLSDKRIRLLAKANPFREGSIKHTRFSKYVDGITVAAYLAQVDFNPLKWDIAAGHIELY